MPLLVYASLVMNDYARLLQLRTLCLAPTTNHFCTEFLVLAYTHKLTAKDFPVPPALVGEVMEFAWRLGLGSLYDFNMVSRYTRDLLSPAPVDQRVLHFSRQSLICQNVSAWLPWLLALSSWLAEENTERSTLRLAALKEQLPSLSKEMFCAEFAFSWLETKAVLMPLAEGASLDWPW